ncbi:hypothetical protein COCON_G00229000 [Conger conger]|uniref:AIG1-type G domain-containing protein n=1 Tax=Conger conger TaxID=82655 RepID=A0A9Q1CV44_CONCO|nr:hypothetical protein COCON_G00229000 [Conger conger]
MIVYALGQPRWGRCLSLNTHVLLTSSRRRTRPLGAACRSAGRAALGEELGREHRPGRRDVSHRGTHTGVCVGRRGQAGTRPVTVVDTPGWWCDFQARDTPELLKQEIVWRGATRSLPGPHAFLLAVKASSAFTEKRRRAAEEHLALFGERVWAHTLVLFTWGDWLGHTTVRQHVEKQGKALQWLVGKCGNRYHVLSNKAPTTAAQVAELMDKVDKMVAGNGGRHYETDRKALQEEEERREAVNERVKQRQAEVKKQRSLLTGAVRSLPELRVVLLGAHRSGKSSAGNRILGGAEFRVGARTASCAAGRGGAAGRRVTVIDTPGWWMNYRADESAEFDRREVRRSAGLCPPGPHAVLLAVRADRAFWDTHRRALEEHVELLGEGVWRHAVVLFTFGDWLGGRSAEEHVEAEGGALRWLVQKCGNRSHVFGSGNGGEVAQLLERIEETVAGNGGRHYAPGGISREAEEERRNAVERRAKERMSKAQEQRRAIRSLLPGGIPTLSDLTVVLLGGVSVGKSSAGNTILGREVFEAGLKTERWREAEGRACGRRVTVVDTRGWRTGRSEAGEREIRDAPSLRSLKPNTLLLVVNASASFTETHRRATEEGLELLLGEGAWSRALVLFTHGDWLGGTAVEQRIEAEGGALRWLVDRCRNRYHVVDNKSEGDAQEQVRELLEKIEETEAGRREAERQQRNEEITAQLHARRLEEELDTDPLLPVCTGHHRCETKWGSSGKTLETQDSLKLHILPVLSLILQSRSRPGRSAGESITPGRGREGSRAQEPGGPPLRMERDVSRDGTAGQVVNASGPKPQRPILVFPGDQPSWRSRERAGEVSGKVWAELAAILLTRVEGLNEGDGPVRSGSGDTASTIEELEAFIDAYFETVRGGAVTSPSAVETRPDYSTGSRRPSSSRPPIRVGGGHTEPDDGSLSSIDQKLSKLDILEAMQRRLADVDQTLRRSLQVLQELRGNR